MTIKTLEPWVMDLATDWPLDDDEYLYRITERNITTIVDKINEIIDVVNDRHASVGTNEQE